jgi:hypothetical protein
MLRIEAAVDRMAPIRGHTLSGVRQDVTVRVYAADGVALEIDGLTFACAGREEALALLDEYLRLAEARAAAAAATPV